MFFRLTALICCASMAVIPGARAFETKATSALIVDHGTGMVLYAKNETEPLPPASMSKLMTLYMLFEAIRDGRVTKETEFDVSARANAMGGSRMFLEVGTKVPVDALIHGIIVQSGNDACVVVAEGLAGSEEAFSEQMTKRARELGMHGTTLKNASGWPEPGHAMSAEDLVALSRHIIDEFPEFYGYFAETEFTWNNITQANRNPLLTLGIGADGLKTGHTEEAGYGLVGSAVQDGQRIVFKVSGLSSSAERAAETTALVKWAFGSFDTVKFFAQGETVAEAEVWMGEAETVPMVAPVPLQMLVPRDGRDGIAASIRYEGPIEAPVTAGQRLGALVVEVPGGETVSFDLLAGADVPRGGLMTRISAAAHVARDRVLEVLPGGDR
jgi:D-alanyl-D-alanine carboxypeptidase (penicillin-binding protein 5/6)